MATVKDIRDRLELSKEYPSGLQYKTSTCRSKKGMQAGCKSSTGHYNVSVNGTRYYTHHIVALLAGIEGIHKVRQSARLGNKEHVLDHIDGNKENNQPSNLRVVSSRLNVIAHYNSKERELPLGVTKAKGKFQSSITRDGIQIYLGRFNTPELAHAAYIAKAKELHPNDDNYIINC